MKKILLILILFFSLWANAQNEQLANNYFDRGDFEKALLSYEDLLKNQIGNFNYFQRIIECYQQLQQYDKAQKAIEVQLDKFKQNQLLVELGYNFQLQKDQEKANKYYNQAIEKIKKNANEVYGIAYVFEKGKNADIWISPSFYTSISNIEKANDLYSKFKAFKNKQVYSFVNKKGEKGGITYFELAPALPDLVLKDLIKIAHPKLLIDYEFTFFEKLN